MFAELQDVLTRKKFDRYVDLSIRMAFLELVRTRARIFEGIPQGKACRDPTDDKFLALAVHAQARIIVTGDDDLLELHPFRGIDIVSPSDYLDNVAAKESK